MYPLSLCCYGVSFQAVLGSTKTQGLSFSFLISAGGGHLQSLIHYEPSSALVHDVNITMILNTALSITLRIVIHSLHVFHYNTRSLEGRAKHDMCHWISQVLFIE